DFAITTPNTNISGFFSNLPTNNFTLTVLLTGSGNVTRSFSSGFYTNGTNITLTANPDAGWLFASWTGDATSSANPVSVLMNTNKIVTANFMLQAPGNQAPVVTLANPTNGASFVAPGIVNLSATAGDADGTVSRVDFFAGTTLVATATNAAPGTNLL